MENKSTEQKKRLTTRGFVKDIINGFAIGVAFIIPGFSGGSVAAILGIYERMVGAIADIYKSFKKSLLVLLPVFIGLAGGVISLLFPLEAALGAFPFPTVSLFVGLAIGGLPSILEKLGGKPAVPHIASFSLALISALALSFLPIGEDVNLLNVTFIGCVLLFLVGIIGSAALVVPGISGSMLLLIFGYYNPIVNMATDHLFKGRDVGVALLVLSCVGIGIVFGFIGISVVMKKLLACCHKGTYYAILGFILGSLPTVYISTAKDAGVTPQTFPTDAPHIIACILMLALGITVSLCLIYFAKKSEKKENCENAANEENGISDNEIANDNS